MKLELRTWRHFDDATEMIEDGGLCAKTPLQKRAAARRARKKEGDLDIVEGEHFSYGYCCSFGAPSREAFQVILFSETNLTIYMHRA